MPLWAPSAAHAQSLAAGHQIWTRTSTSAGGLRGIPSEPPTPLLLAQSLHTHTQQDTDFSSQRNQTYSGLLLFVCVPFLFTSRETVMTFPRVTEYLF